MCLLATSLFTGADHIIGVHYRGTDTATEFPYRKVPYAQIAGRIDAALARVIASAKQKRDIEGG